MKQTLYIICFLALGLVGKAQGVDSSRIPQSPKLKAVHHMYILSNLNNWGDPSTINYINQVRSQYDSTRLDSLIEVTVPSSFIVNAFQQLSYQPEGQATSMNEEIEGELMKWLNNPWLFGRLYQIKLQNWAARDAKIHVTTERFLTIDKLP